MLNAQGTRSLSCVWLRVVKHLGAGEYCIVSHFKFNLNAGNDPHLDAVHTCRSSPEVWSVILALLALEVHW